MRDTDDRSNEDVEQVEDASYTVCGCRYTKDMVLRLISPPTLVSRLTYHTKETETSYAGYDTHSKYRPSSESSPLWSN